MSPRPLILIAEDDALLQLDLIFAFEAVGIDTICANSADAAMALLDTPGLSGLLTDIDMPGALDGIDLAQAFAGRHPGKPLLVHSGGARPAAGRMPACGQFLSKPSAFPRILAALGLARDIRRAA